MISFFIAKQKAGILLSLCLLVSLTSFGQQDFHKGFIITHTGDTLQRLISFSPLSQYKVCKAKEENSDNLREYKPGEIKGYGFVDGKFFETLQIPFADSKEVMFTEKLVAGKMSLYRYRDSYFVTKDDTARYELIVEREEVERNSVKYTKATVKNLGLLYYDLSDCATTKHNLTGDNFREKSITELIVAYNRCVSEEFTEVKAGKPWLLYSVGVQGGLVRSSIDFISDHWEFNSLRHAHFNTPVSFSAGITSNLSSPRISERFSLNVELLYNQSRFFSNYSVYYAPAESTTKYDIELSYHELRIPVSVRYTLWHKQISPYFNVGVSGNILLKESSRVRTEVNSQTRSEIQDQEQVYAPNKQQFGVFGGIGVNKSFTKKHILFLEARYEVTNGISARTDYNFNSLRINSEVANIYMLLGIRF